MFDTMKENSLCQWIRSLKLVSCIIKSCKMWNYCKMLQISVTNLQWKGLQIRLLQRWCIKQSNAVGSSVIIIEMIKTANNGIIDCILSLFNHIIYEARVTNNWHLFYIINHFNRKGDALSFGNYRRLRLQDHRMKVLQHNLNTVICEQVYVNKIQFGIMPGTVMTDAISYSGSCKKITCIRRKTPTLHLLT